jgi:hypothetical protein
MNAGTAIALSQHEQLNQVVPKVDEPLNSYQYMNWKPILTKLVVVIATIVNASTYASGASTYFVREGATGNNNGSDWTNAYKALPTSLVRGATYYIADGSYGSPEFQDPVSGTQTITIKKAIVNDHGTSTGWQDAYGDGQAVFQWIRIYTDYYVFDGQVRNADWRTGGINQYGISAGHARLDNAYDKHSNFLTFKNVEFHGDGRDTNEGDDVIYGVYGNTNITFQNCALHDSDRTIWCLRGSWKNLTVDHCYIARNSSFPSVNGEMISMTDSDNFIFSSNAIEDIEGSAIWAGVNGGTMSNWKIYGNTVVHTDAYLNNIGRKTQKSWDNKYDENHTWGISGAIFIGNDSNYQAFGNNFQIYNNTFVNVVGLWSGFVIQAGAGNFAQNNMWYNCVRTSNSHVTQGWNWYYNTQADWDDTPTKQINIDGKAFVSIPNRDFHLIAPTQAGTILGSPMNVDGDGVTRGADGTWDRGAYEYVSHSNHPPFANPQTVTTDEDTAKAITLTATDSDGDSLTYSITSLPQHGSLTGTGANRTYTPAATYNGSDSFIFQADDGKGGSSAATVSITVIPVNDAPTVNITSPANGASFAAGSSITMTVDASDLDGNISQVECFYAANGTTTSLGMATLTPGTSTYTLTKTKVRAGSYILTAKATDDSGSVTTSTGVSITVTK